MHACCGMAALPPPRCRIDAERQLAEAWDVARRAQASAKCARMHADHSATRVAVMVRNLELLEEHQRQVQAALSHRVAEVLAPIPFKERPFHGGLTDEQFDAVQAEVSAAYPPPVLAEPPS